MADTSKLDTAIKFGAGRYRQERGLIGSCGEEVARFGTRPLVVTGPNSWAAVGEPLLEDFAAAGLAPKVEVFDGWCSFEAAEDLAKAARAHGADEIVGVGGGKIMDLAKAVGETAGLGTVNIPTSASSCAPFTCMSVMYTAEGGKKLSWRFDHEIDACLMDMDVIAACPIRFNAAGIIDAMAKRIEMLNGKPALSLDDTPVDVFTAYSVAEYTYRVLKDVALRAIEDNRRHEATKALNDMAFMNVPVTGVIANTTKSFRQSELAHVIYDGVRTIFTEEGQDAIHGEVVGVGLFCQLYFNGQQGQEQELRDLMRAMDMPLTFPDLGIKATDKNLDAIEEYIVNSRHYNSTDPADRRRLHEAVHEMA
ncbi:iron-containing alcohol dehydrogenase family protein [Olsenella sp. HMSC062G07]|uniref:iron-containing alcohol dehydrogenase family protein n=1 Tax=Olsenella sp. HMSC062G07 TaxID=1739330 RepID=UPI0008A3A0DE|nr:iron-containing alcohol dehydrogenase family protein [Olsenella sp. HMSC062G07]OFK23703.1 alcohol dehydrogenase [Olsenella sp. HMSC062G07]